MFCYICLQILSTFFLHFFKHFFSVFQSCTSFHIFFQLLFFPDFPWFYIFWDSFSKWSSSMVFDGEVSEATCRDLRKQCETSCLLRRTVNLTNVCFELDCWTRWTRWTVFWKKYLWVCSGMFWGWHWGRGPWWRPNEWGNSAMWDWGMDVNERTGMRWNEEGLNITLPRGLAIIEMDSDLLETKGCKEPMENLETFSTQRSAAEGDGETPEPVLKAPRRRTG